MAMEAFPSNSRFWKSSDDHFGKTLSLARAVNFDYNTRRSRMAANENSILNFPLFRSTVFNFEPALLNQSHFSSLDFMIRASSHSQATNSRDSRFTINSTVRPKPPSSRQLNTQASAGTVHALRFYSHARPSTRILSFRLSLSFNVSLNFL